MPEQSMKGSKPERHDLIPVGPLGTLARQYAWGAEKYEPHNWRVGHDWSKSYAAMQRHSQQFWAGEDIDPESGLPHLAAVAWHAFTLMEFMEQHPQLDDRYRSESPAQEFAKQINELRMPAHLEQEAQEKHLKGCELDTDHVGPCGRRGESWALRSERTRKLQAQEAELDPAVANGSTVDGLPVWTFGPDGSGLNLTLATGQAYEGRKHHPNCIGRHATGGRCLRPTHYSDYLKED